MELAEPPILERGAIRLRPWGQQDSAAVEEAGRDTDLADHAGIDLSSPNAGQGYVRRQRLRRERGLGYSFAVADPSDRAIGQVGVWLRDPAPDGPTGYVEEPHGRAALSYWVTPPQRGRAVAAQALDLAAPWLLAQPHIDRLELLIEPSNIASWRTAERAGFEREGLLRSWYRRNGQRRDVYLYARLPAAH